MRVRGSRNRKRRMKRKRTLKGGNKKIVYYTCFFGPNGSAAHVIPERPSKTSDCFYYTNNKDASQEARNAGWTVIDMPIEIKSTNRNNAMDSKELKACPHHFNELKGYTYSCYFDSKRYAKEEEIISMLDSMTGDVVMLINRHPGIKGARQELEVALWQPRYAQNKNKYEGLINEKLNEGYSNVSEYHYETNVILRKCGDITERIGEDWFADIKRTGAECQISFAFIQQKYKDNVRPLPVYYGYVAW